MDYTVEGMLINQEQSLWLLVPLSGGNLKKLIVKISRFAQNSPFSQIILSQKIYCSEKYVLLLFIV